MKETPESIGDLNTQASLYVNAVQVPPGGVASNFHISKEGLVTPAEPGAVDKVVKELKIKMQVNASEQFKRMFYGTPAPLPPTYAPGGVLMNSSQSGTRTYEHGERPPLLDAFRVAPYNDPDEELTRLSSLDLREVYTRGPMRVTRLSCGSGMPPSWLVESSIGQYVVGADSARPSFALVQYILDAQAAEDATWSKDATHRSSINTLGRYSRDAPVDHVVNGKALEGRIDTPATTWMLRTLLASDNPFVSKIVVGPGLLLEVTLGSGEIEDNIKGRNIRIFLYWNLGPELRRINIDMGMLILDDEMYAVNDLLRACVSCISEAPLDKRYVGCRECGNPGLSAEYDSAIESLSNSNMLVPIVTAGFGVCIQCATKFSRTIRQQEQYLNEGAVPDF